MPLSYEEKKKLLIKKLSEKDCLPPGDWVDIQTGEILIFI